MFYLKHLASRHDVSGGKILDKPQMLHMTTNDIVNENVIIHWWKIHSCNLKHLHKLCICGLKIDSNSVCYLKKNGEFRHYLSREIGNSTCNNCKQKMAKFNGWYLLHKLSNIKIQVICICLILEQLTCKIKNSLSLIVYEELSVQ